jgi:hypothetical protein
MYVMAGQNLSAGLWCRVSPQKPSIWAACTARVSASSAESHPLNGFALFHFQSFSYPHPSPPLPTPFLAVLVVNHCQLVLLAAGGPCAIQAQLAQLLIQQRFVC